MRECRRPNPAGLAVYVDELIGFIKSFNKYRNGNDEQMWTQLFTGSNIIVNRDEIPKDITRSWRDIISKILKIPYKGKSKTIRLTKEAMNEYAQ